MNENRENTELTERTAAETVPAEEIPAAENPEGEAPAGENPEEGGEQKPKEEKLPGTGAFEWVQCLVSALVFCIMLFVFVCRTVGVIGPSMQQTLVEPDRLIVSKLFYTPKQGDIVVLRKESFKDDAIIKRVIAVGGQTVDIDFQEGVVYVDGVALDEPYVNAPTYDPEDFTEPVEVPEGCVFVMGDNRNHSTDSRDERIGVVDNRYIIGKALFRITPVSRFGAIY